MDRARKLIHAGEREIYPYDGSGVTAAILDTDAETGSGS